MENPKAVLLLEIIGTSLSSLKMIRKMFFLVGATKSGKSVTVDFLQEMIGADQRYFPGGFNLSNT